MFKTFKRTVAATAAGIAMTLMVFCAPAVAQEPPAYTPPGYQGLRHNEDWSVLAERTTLESEDLFDPIKYVPLDDSGFAWVSFGGQVRERVEIWDDFNFGAPPTADDDDVSLLSRFFLHGDLHFGDHVRAFVQGKSALSTDRDLIGGRRTLDVDEFALQNGFIDLAMELSGDDKVVLRGGRQELLFGKQRLVSPLNWANTRRTFDGLSSIFEHQRGTVAGFWTRPVEVRKYDSNKPDNDVDFYGVYATTQLPAIEAALDTYWLGLEKNDAAFNGSAGREDRHTMGGRLWGKLPDCPLDYDVEGAYQFGEVGDDDIDAFMVASQLGYTFTKCPVVPRLHVGFDYASGDDNAADGEVETFNQLFPLGHGFLGYIDTVGRQNIVDLSTGLSFKPNDKILVALEEHNFWRADDEDALYNAGGVAVRSGSLGSSSEVGSEIDLTVNRTTMLTSAT
jgi:hypothetical protein